MAPISSWWPVKVFFLLLVQSCVSSPTPGPAAVLRRQQNLDFSLRGAPPFASKVISRSGWKVTCNSMRSDNECPKMIDNDTTTFWQSSSAGNLPPPHDVVVDMGSSWSVSGIAMTPRQNASTQGCIGSHQLFLSQDGVAWNTPVAFGTWYADSWVKYTTIEPQTARYVKLVALSEVNNNHRVSIAELNIYTPNKARNTNTGPGRWGATINLPVVPVAAALEPISGRVLIWSSYKEDQFSGSPGGYTLTSTYDPYDPTSLAVKQRTVSETKHDMFCPGISLGADGQVIVTGGRNAEKTSIYRASNDSWVSAGNMVVPRGYQSSATLSDGRIFTIGGSWNGGRTKLKDGEVFTPSSNTWANLSGALVKPMLTNDGQGLFRSDNHAWLFGWKNGSVFQAGPSAAMNWYGTSGTSGSTVPAGPRASDADAMCGTASMYDAVAGKILSVGGSPQYTGVAASYAAHVISIGQPDANATVVKAGNGTLYNRIYHSAVVLPDGTVFITGGQQVGRLFKDSTPQMTPELYDPVADKFTKLASNSIVRVYHSVALLLPDATVFVGGGGLCGQCVTNHLDAQIYTPGYLLTSSGQPAPRPAIRSISAKVFKVGNTVTVVTGGAVAKASLVRHSSVTHTVNTDQRRIPVALKSAGTNKYTFDIPNDPGVALPGYWMLFVLDANGVPSHAMTIQIKPN